MLFFGLLVSWLSAPALFGQSGQAPTTAPAPGLGIAGSGSSIGDLAAVQPLTGRTVEAVRIIGNTQVSTAVILELVRTHEGDKFDPSTVISDYQRIYDKMKMFANVEARIQPTSQGVLVLFIVTEQKQIHEIRYQGNVQIETHDLQVVVDLKPGQAIDDFRISLARQSIEKLYHDKNFPFAHVLVPPDVLSHTGDVVFTIVEGPQVRVRKVDFIGNNSFSAWRLKDQIKTAYYIFIFRPGTFDPEQVDTDVDSLQHFYQDKGFFDVRVGRKLSRSPDMKEMQVTYLIDEGPRYIVDHVEFKGNQKVQEATLRKDMTLLEGTPFDADATNRDIRSIVRNYSKVGGFIYEQQPGMQPNPDYLQINVKKVFKQIPGKVDLIYEIGEGKQFRLERVLIKGNGKTKDNVILREMHMRPGQKYDSAEVEDAADRLRGTPYFTSVAITPVGDDADGRDLLVQVTEARTAQISAGVGVNSNGGFGGNLAYEQKNFDITNVPTSWNELFSDRAFTGAGQDFRASFAPGSQGTDATVSFSEPYIFDQPYSFGIEGYLRNRIRENYDDDRFGGRTQVGERFNYVYSADVFLRGEDVNIKNIFDPQARAPEINAGIGHHTLTSVGIDLQRDTTNHGPITYKGSDTAFSLEQVGALGGNVNFTRISLSFNDYQTISTDLLDRRTVLNSRISVGWDPRSAPFYERFYGGGLDSVRGFSYRGISPRAGPFNDVVGGDFSLTGGVELGFPLAEDFLRGVVFIDAGDVESQARIGSIRSAAGFGFRLNLPFFGQFPLALDFGFPISQSQQDNTQVLSFSFGLSR